VSTRSAQAGEQSAIPAVLPERYRVHERLAVGGMASIWVAEDVVLGRLVAVKVLAEQLASESPFVTRFEREARTAAGLSGHPNVVTIYDVGEHGGRPFIVMEYLEGGTLRDRIAAGDAGRDQMLGWLRDAASALDYLHGHDVVHRDVKPRNLLLHRSGRVVVADLGIARAAYQDSLTTTGELLGTASYISPEQAMGDRATPASDRYSLAVVAYELLTGTLPFGGSNFAEQALRRIESEPDPPSARTPALGPAVDRVLLKALAKDPGERWPSAAAFVAALDEALALDPRTPEPAPARSRSHARPAAVAAVVVALAAVVGVVALGTGGGGGGGGTAGSPKQHAGAKSKPASPKTAAATPAPPVTGGQSGAALNDQGFALMRAGRYEEAVPVLQRAVAAFGSGSSDLTYAYALYNLGHSLRLSGRPREAIPYLERRLRIPNQQALVRRELATARAAASG
jgi:eukaryotic-like serine/threonine-protein kinase